MRRLIVPFLAVVMIATAGCVGLSQTEQRALTGGAAGAASGAVIGAIAGNVGLGAAIGAGTGLLGGFLYGQHEESKQAPYQKGVQDGYKQAQSSSR
jgi:osmotically inducible lipoprotein OsmB